MVSVISTLPAAGIQATFLRLLLLELKVSVFHSKDQIHILEITRLEILSSIRLQKIRNQKLFYFLG